MDNKWNKNFSEYKDINKEIEKRISSYENKYMNNSKWKKLFLTIFSNINIIKQCEIRDFFNSGYIYIKTNLNNIEYKNYIHNECIDNNLFSGSEYPVCNYKEIEYLEFAKYWNEEASGRLLKQKIIEQDINKIKETISKIGIFEWEETEKYLRIIGYK
jgi:hypothetical protein